MNWKYDHARFYGTKSNPKTGDHVKVRLVDEDSPGELDYRILQWGFDEADGISAIQFRNMVKGEVKAHLIMLNSAQPEHNEDNDFKPA